MLTNSYISYINNNQSLLLLPYAYFTYRLIEKSKHSQTFLTVVLISTECVTDLD
jgi:hypothetical protein